MGYGASIDIEKKEKLVIEALRNSENKHLKSLWSVLENTQNTQETFRKFVLNLNDSAMNHGLEFEKLLAAVLTQLKQGFITIADALYGKIYVNASAITY
ncbi:MAG: hypothetical protein PHP54_02875 [Clostridia bacterium]|nr:hypothetical protein [Clostridia bacterium]